MNNEFKSNNFSSDPLSPLVENTHDLFNSVAEQQFDQDFQFYPETTESIQTSKPSETLTKSYLQRKHSLQSVGYKF